MDQPDPAVDVVVEIAGENGEPESCYIKRLIRRTSRHIVLKQFNPSRELSFKNDKVLAVHRILSAAELIGA